jgi:flagellar basal body-associated protein FliL
MKKSIIIWIIVGILGFLLVVFAAGTFFVSQVTMVKYGTPHYRPKIL